MGSCCAKIQRGLASMRIRALLMFLAPLGSASVLIPQLAQATACQGLHTLTLAQSTITESIRVPAGSLKNPNAPSPPGDLPGPSPVNSLSRPTSDSETNFKIS